jgi:hypothetical protein
MVKVIINILEMSTFKNTIHLNYKNNKLEVTEKLNN